MAVDNSSIILIVRVFGIILIAFVLYMLWKSLGKEKIGKKANRMAWILFAILMIIGIALLSIVIFSFTSASTEGSDIAAITLSFFALLPITAGVLIILGAYEKLGSRRPGKSRKPTKSAAWLVFLLLELIGISGLLLAINSYYLNQVVVAIFSTLSAILFIPLGILLLLAAYGKYGDLD